MTSYNPVSPENIFEDLNLTREQILNDYRIVCLSRHISLMGRKEVLTGKAKFGIFGAGKEVPQVALAHFYKKGDYRSGYYRDQTLMLAAGLVTPKQLFSQLYADPNTEREPHSSGRQMNAHFATKNINSDGEWISTLEQKNTASDISCTSAQMGRAVGLALASKKYRNLKNIESDLFSDNGNEVCFATIGDSSTSEGLFFESINAAAVMKIPMAVCVWDDGYGISVPKEYQTTKSSISEALRGFEIQEGDMNGIEIYNVKAWQYYNLIKTYKNGIEKIRETHIPALFHIDECTQPQGHSTSGSHERYKTKERLEWEADYDCNKQFKHWLIASEIAELEELDAIEKETKREASIAKKEAWEEFNNDTLVEMREFLNLLEPLKSNNANSVFELHKKLSSTQYLTRHELVSVIKNFLFEIRNVNRNAHIQNIIDFKNKLEEKHLSLYNTNLYLENSASTLKVKSVEPEYDENSKKIPGYQILNYFFNQAFETNSKLLAFGEDVGQIGGVNQGFVGLQKKFGEERIFDTGIREATIIGQAIGLSMRGFRPIAEIQYLDYFLWGLQPLSDDVATLHYRTDGRQIAPLIIRTRGHRLEGVWHTGSPMGLLINALRGMHLCVPRNMVQAVGMYNTILKGKDPAVVVESLNGYRLREKLPNNLGEFCVELGVPEVLRKGTDLTILTYGSCVRIAETTCEKLAKVGINAELIDVQTLLPFDKYHIVTNSLKKTNKLIIMDEDVPGGASAYLQQQILEKQNGFEYLDAKAICLTASENRTPFGSDGDYYCKPSHDALFETAYKLMHEYNPKEYPMFF